MLPAPDRRNVGLVWGATLDGHLGTFEHLKCPTHLHMGSTSPGPQAAEAAAVNSSVQQHGTVVTTGSLTPVEHTTQQRTSIARAACGRTSASHAVRHVVQKQVDAVRKRHRACKTSEAVVAVGASCATAVAVGRTRPERVRPARGRGDNELTVGRISKRLPQ